MKTLIFSRQDHVIIQSIEQVIISLGNIDLEYVRGPGEFKQALKLCYAGETLVVFFVHGKNDLAFLESVEMDFMDIKLVIYFIDREDDLLARAYKMDPRIVTGAFDSDELLIAAVRGILLNLTGAKAVIKD